MPVRPLLALILAMAPAGPAAADCRFTLNFAFDSARLSRSDALLLRDLARLYPEGPVSVAGHADDDGSPPGNRRIAEARARAVVQQLRVSGLNPAAPVSAAAYAADWDAVPSNASSALNRRAEVLVGGCVPARHVEARPARTPGIQLGEAGGIELTGPKLP